jgi:hypothetical protein
MRHIYRIFVMPEIDQKAGAISDNIKIEITF